MSGTSYCINKKQVAHESFDGEILAVNLETGTYYSLTGVAARIWELLLNGSSVGVIIQTLRETCSGNQNEIASSVTAFVERLLRENLISAGEPIARTVPMRSVPNNREKVPFSEPTLEVFSDMQDLLLLDPIHDVDEAGWPVLKSGADNK